MRSIHTLALLGSVVLAACTPPEVEKTTGTATDTGSGESVHVAVDADADGIGAPADCDDADPTVNPLARDAAGDGIDADCDGVDGVDRDGDAYAGRATGGTDCDDSNPAVHPGAADASVDGVDQDCSGLDGSAGSQRTDLDGDGYDGIAFGGVDCDDGNAALNPAATDLVGDSFDQNCDGVDGFDADADGHAATWSGGHDCDDAAAGVYPGADDTSTDGVDQDCTGVDGVDADGDGFPSSAFGGADCDDTDAAVHPGARDDATEGDQDCDGSTDEDVFVDVELDFDRDGFGSRLLGGDDCDDLNGAVNPRATDLVGDDEDQNCDGLDGTDADGDGVASRLSGGTDCLDTDASVNPGRADAAVDGTDQDCSGVDGVDADGDGFASEESGGTDCDDDDEEISPAGFDLWVDSVDQDCNGADGDGLEPAGADADRDGFVSEAEGGRDCDDHRAGINPWATDMAGDDVDQNCDGVDGSDADRDGQLSVASGGLDCADDDRFTFFGAAYKERDEGDNPFCARDEDGDGWGDPTFEAPEMYAWGAGMRILAAPGHDCDDTRVTVAPDLLDLDAHDGVDANCDGSDADDNDGDGYADVNAGGDDCSDESAQLHPDPRLPDVCGYDNDGDGYVAYGWSGEAPNDWDTGSSGGSYPVEPLPETGPREACWIPEMELCYEARDGAALTAVCERDGGTYDASAGCGDEWGTPGSCVVSLPDGVTVNVQSAGGDWADPDFCGWVGGTWYEDGSGGTLVVPLRGSDCDDDDGSTYPGSAIEEGDPDLCAHDRDGDGWANEGEGGSDCLDQQPDVWTSVRNVDGDVVYADWGGPAIAAQTHPGAAALEPALCGIDSDDDGYARAGFERVWVDDLGTYMGDYGVRWVEGYEEHIYVPLGVFDGADVEWGSDCVDTDDAVRPGAARNEPVGTCTADRDGDGWGDHAVSGHDCDDGDTAVVPRLEVCNGADDDCDGTVDNNALDADHDGSPSCLDCDDHNAARATGRVEVCDGAGVDNDCNADTHDDADDDGDGFTVCGGDCAALDGEVYPGSLSQEPDPTVCAQDRDGDGYGAAADGGSDCDDTKSYMHPDTSNGVCGEDLDGDGTVREQDGGTDCDDGSAERMRDPLTDACGDDGDRDGYVASYDGGSDCRDWNASYHPGRLEPDACGPDYDGDGYVRSDWGGTDCDDGDVTIYPGAAYNEPDVCGPDPDGDGYVDTGWGGTDCDGWNAAIHPGVGYNEPEVCGPDADGDGYVTTDWGGTDCYDTDDTVHPGAAYNEPDRCTYDQDGDGWGDRYYNGTDCDDGDPSVVPQPETCNGLDDDCDGATDEIDEDEDGVTLCAGDCADEDAARFPGNPEQCDGIDNDCDATTDENVDRDGDGYTLCDNDCDDDRATVNPGGVDGGAHGDSCDGLDNDCDGLVDETTTCQGCQETLEYGASYLNCTVFHNWDDARTYCQAMGGDLASAESIGESTFIGNLSRQGVSWVGAYYTSSGGWTLVSGGVYRFAYNQTASSDRARLAAHPDFITQFPGDNGANYTCERADLSGDADGDGDGYVAEGRGGTDCNDADADVHPDVAGRVCGLDADGDGQVREADGGRDCDDSNPAAALRAADPDCDGIVIEADTLSLVPAGSFDMGCTPGQTDCEGDEYPVTTITLTRAFYVMETEVTQGQFEGLMGYNPSAFSGCGADCPVEQVNWYQAAAFANAASAAEGFVSCYTCWGSGSAVECEAPADPYACEGYRLLTEAEWEYAARCGSDTVAAGSNTVADVAWYEGNSGYTTHPVAMLSPNACGLYDMSGNVYEWVNDWYTEGGASTSTGTGTSTDTSTGTGTDTSTGTTDPVPPFQWWTPYKSYRGGGYGSWRMSVANRDAGYPWDSVEYLGLRLARTAP
jgi:formylglycine-generating enzyme required for sulfatase activity